MIDQEGYCHLSSKVERVDQVGQSCGKSEQRVFTHYKYRLTQIRQAACTGVKCDVMDKNRWGWECMLQLQEAEDRKTPVATTQATEFLLRAGESREFLGSWINSRERERERERSFIDNQEGTEGP